MPILSKPVTITKGQNHEFVLDSDLLVAKLTALSATAHFKNPANWSSVCLNYFNSFGQAKSVAINMASLKGNFTPSVGALASFDIFSITIYDFDGLHYTIPRANLNASEFDVSLTGGGGGSVGTSYRYLKFFGIDGDSGNGSFGLAEVQLTADGIVTTLAGKLSILATDAQIYGSMTNGVLVPPSGQSDVVYFTNMLPPTGKDLFKIDLGSSKIINSIHLAPQDGGSGTAINQPRKFKLLASNDDITYVEILSVTNATSWVSGQFTVFPVVAPSYNYISWESKALYTSEADGGLTTTNTTPSTQSSAIVYSSTIFNVTSDFEVVINFNTKNTGLLGYPVTTFIGINNGDVNAYPLYGIYQDSTGGPYILIRGASSAGSVSILLGDNTLIFKRVGDLFTISFNGTVGYSNASANSTLVGSDGKLAIRMSGGLDIISAYTL